LGHVADAQTFDGVRLHGLDVLPVERDPSPAGLEKPEHGLQQRRLAGAVRPDDARDRARAHREADAVQNIDLGGIPGDHPIHIEERHSQAPR
jgi:hypothetical protein